MAIVTKPLPLPVWAESGEKVQPSNAEIAEGWPLSATPPSRQRFNWILGYSAQIGRYLMQNGIGFIPAGAGNSPAHHAALIHFSVHPRWRGEQAASHFVAIKKHGSSPLARGTGVPINMCNKQFRFIPAGAGNRNMERKISVTAAVHPRWRGEQPSESAAMMAACGSSPLARGTAAVVSLIIE